MPKVKMRMKARVVVSCPEINFRERLQRDCEECKQNKGINGLTMEVDCQHPRSEAKEKKEEE